MGVIPPLPPGWTERTEWDSRSADAVGRLALCRRADRTITYWPRWWLALFWPLIRLWVRGHERGHAWGVPASGCLAGRSDCLMSEEPGGRDSWVGKARLWPRQIMRLGRLCPACGAFISKRMSEERAC